MNLLQKKMLGDFSRLMMQIDLLEKNLKKKVYPKSQVKEYEDKLKEMKEEFLKLNRMMSNQNAVSSSVVAGIKS